MIAVQWTQRVYQDKGSTPSLALPHGPGLQKLTTDSVGLFIYLNNYQTTDIYNSLKSVPLIHNLPIKLVYFVMLPFWPCNISYTLFHIKNGREAMHKVRLGWNASAIFRLPENMRMSKQDVIETLAVTRDAIWRYDIMSILKVGQVYYHDILLHTCVNTRVCTGYATFKCKKVLHLQLDVAIKTFMLTKHINIVQRKFPFTNDTHEPATFACWKESITRKEQATQDRDCCLREAVL